MRHIQQCNEKGEADAGSSRRRETEGKRVVDEWYQWSISSSTKILVPLLLFHFRVFVVQGKRMRRRTLLFVPLGCLRHTALSTVQFSRYLSSTSPIHSFIYSLFSLFWFHVSFLLLGLLLLYWLPFFLRPFFRRWNVMVHHICITKKRRSSLTNPIPTISFFRYCIHPSSFPPCLFSLTHSIFLWWLSLLPGTHDIMCSISIIDPLIPLKHNQSTSQFFSF